METTQAQLKNGIKARQYKDADKILIEAGELSDTMIHEQTGTSIKVISMLRYRLKVKAEKETNLPKRKYTKKNMQIAVIEKVAVKTKECKIMFNGMELCFAKPVKRVRFTGDYSVEIDG